MKNHTINSSAQDAGQRNQITLEGMQRAKIGTREKYLLSTKAVCRPIADKLGIKCWVEKRRKEADEFEKNLRTFIDIPTGYITIYGITYKGADFDCGDMPRDLGKVIQGIGIASQV